MKNQKSTREKEIEEVLREVFGREKRSYKKLYIFAILIGSLLSVFFFFILPIFIKPYFAQKPDLVKPPLVSLPIEPSLNKSVNEGEDEQSNETSAIYITNGHVTWMVNELDGYKLHSSLSWEAPLIEIIIGKDIFTSTTVENKVFSYSGASANPDIKIITDTETFEVLYNSENPREKVAELYYDGKIQVEQMKDIVILMEKGYKAIYDVLSA